MLGGPQKWLNDPTLSINEQSRQTQGFKKCIQEWDTFELSVSMGNFNIRERSRETQASPSQEMFEELSGTDDGQSVKTAPRIIRSPWDPPVISPGPSPPPRTPRDTSVPARAIIGAVVERVAMAHSRLGLHSWDVLGRLRAVSQWVPDRPYDRSGVKAMNNLVQCAKETLSAVEAELPNYFT